MAQPYRDWHDIYEDRGDPTTWDFTLADLTTDGAWRDLDLSGIVPENAKAVFLRLRIADDVVGSLIAFKEKGNSNNYNISQANIQIASTITNYDLGPIRLSRNRVIQYSATNTVWTIIDVVVKGWLY